MIKIINGEPFLVTWGCVFNCGFTDDDYWVVADHERAQHDGVQSSLGTDKVANADENMLPEDDGYYDDLDACPCDCCRA